MLVTAGVHWQPFSDLALAELPQVANPEDWHLPEEEVLHRRDLRGSEYFVCSIDPPGKSRTYVTAVLIYSIKSILLKTVLKRASGVLASSIMIEADVNLKLLF